MALKSPESSQPLIEESKEQEQQFELNLSLLPRRERQRHSDLHNIEFMHILDKDNNDKGNDNCSIDLGNRIQSTNQNVDRDDKPNNEVQSQPNRGHPLYLSGLIQSASSIVLQNQFYIFFLLEKDNLSEGNKYAKIPLEELHETVTVSEAIHSAIQLLNNTFLLQRQDIKLIGDDRDYELYIAKKDGRKKSSLPSLYPQEKMSRFPKSNLLLVSKDPKNIVREPNKDIKVIKEANESMSSFISADHGLNSPTKSVSKRRESKNQQSPEKNHHHHHHHHKKAKNSKIIQSTITTKQTKLEAEEKDTGEAFSNMTSQSKCCFPFGSCWSSPKISSSDPTIQASTKSEKNNSHSSPQIAKNAIPPGYSTSR